MTQHQRAIAELVLEPALHLLGEHRDHVRGRRAAGDLVRGEFALVVHAHEGPAQDPVQDAEKVLSLLLAAGARDVS